MQYLDNKVVIIGDSGVGKSTLMHWILYDKFINNMEPTIGASFGIKEFNIANQKIKLHIWDTAGQERFRSICPLYYKNTIGCICVFDVTNRESFERVEYWLREHQQHNCNNKYATILIANKSDKNYLSWQISKEEIDQYSTSNNLQYIYTNCITGKNIAEAFTMLTRSIIRLRRTLLMTNDNFDISTYINFGYNDLKDKSDNKSDDCVSC